MKEHRLGTILIGAMLALQWTGLPSAVADEGPSVAAELSVYLVRHVEQSDGRVLGSSDASVPINPASVVKVATSLWALERLGPDHRYETRMTVRGSFDPRTGVLDGDLLVFGGGDPDFHVENAQLMAIEMNRAGLHVVRGKLLVDERFWIGWEGGSERAPLDVEQRATRMAARLRDALDRGRWDRRTRRILQDFATRRGTSLAPRGISIEGGVGFHAGVESGAVLLIHHSNPLRHTLKRFNAYSNNDIERLGVLLGSPDDLASALAKRWADESPRPQLETLSGLGTNRMTARQVVRVLRDLEGVCRRFDLQLDEILPVAGCDPGTLSHFPVLETQAAGALVAKTGTLIRTDGGVASMAGLARTKSGDRFFCVAAPDAGGKLTRARRAEERWLLDMVARGGGARPAECRGAVGYSDDDARVESTHALQTTDELLKLGQR